MNKKPIRIIGLITALFLFSLLLSPFAYPKKVTAGTLTNTFVRLDRVQGGQATTGLVCATTSTTVGTEVDVQVVFPTGFTVSTTVGNWTVATTNIPSGATAWPGIDTASAASGQTVTFPSTALAISTQYCFRWTNTSALTNASAADNLTGSVTTRATGPSAIDTTNYAVSTITADQISVSATVPLIFTLALSGTTMPLGTLSTSSTVSSTARTVSIGTNAASGWLAWIAGTNGNSSLGALTSTVASASISAPGSSSDNTPTDLASNTGYVIDADITTDGSNGTGTVSQASNFGAEFAGANSTSGGSVTTLLQPFAASNGTTDGDVITLTARAKVTSFQAAATDYADTLTVVATGRF